MFCARLGVSNTGLFSVSSAALHRAPAVLFRQNCRCLFSSRFKRSGLSFAMSSGSAGVSTACSDTASESKGVRDKLDRDQFTQDVDLIALRIVARDSSQFVQRFLKPTPYVPIARVPFAAVHTMYNMPIQLLVPLCITMSRLDSFSIEPR